MRGDTPATLAGGTVLDLPALEALMAKKPLLLDFGPAPRKPDDFPKNGIWLPTHRSIPGAVWMPGAGAAPLDPAREALFYERVGALTAGDKAKPVVAFCHPQCWASWNAAKRLVLKGYRSVYWFPGGIESWQKAHETAAVKPDGGWSAGGAK
jgi:PQQ-dependent catabolism-associated CXXCW motif protein